MDYREIIESNDSVIIKGVKNFNINIGMWTVL